MRLEQLSDNYLLLMTKRLKGSINEDGILLFLSQFFFFWLALFFCFGLSGIVWSRRTESGLISLRAKIRSLHVD